MKSAWNIPYARTFTNIHRRMCQKRSFEPYNHLKTARRTVRTPEIVIGNNLNIAHILVWKTLHDFVFNPYHIQGVRLYSLVTFHYGWTFANGSLYENPIFYIKILFTDEANFSINAIQAFTVIILRLKKTHTQSRNLVRRIILEH